MAGERGTVLDPRTGIVVHRREVQQHREPGSSLDEGADRGAAQAEDQIALPVAGHRAVLDLGGPLADQDRLAHETLAASSAAGSGNTQRPPGPQTGCELAPQRSAPLHIQRLVDRLVGDPHRRIIVEIDRQAGSDLLRTPRPRPPAIRAAAVTPADPPHRRTRDSAPVRPLDRAGEPVLHVSPEILVGGELRGLRTLGAQIGVPLRGRGPVIKAAGACRGVAPQLPGDRRR